MLNRILLVSVGGSADPIVNAIKEHNPDFVYFFCSSGPRGSEKTIDGPGDPCGDKRRTKCPECGHIHYIGDPKGRAIAFQAGLAKDQYEIVAVDNPDDLNVCYRRLLELAEQIEVVHEDCQIIANYTGGTKTMSAAMALVGVMTEQWDLSLNVGPRRDLIHVRSGDVPVVIDKWSIFYQNRLESQREPLENHYYAFVASSISEMLHRPIEGSLRDRLIETKVICEAFDLWDRFRHEAALELLEPYGRKFAPYIIHAKKILGTIRATGYELVPDLLKNAERRAIQKHYDDAISRLYRATELFAQIRLEKEYGYQTDDLRLNQLPKNLRDEYKEHLRGDKLILGLRNDYELLSKLKDPIGRTFKEREVRIIDALTRRNSSIGAHGLIPMGARDYHLVADSLGGFIMEASGGIGVDLTMEQLPGSEILR
ncbi:MAG: TIGR02710 family CRISPR-associated protein [Candidatus Methanogaster sp.]|uniref:TIGR02710 family CRISPR-associated protein n=1 Tax=Candidatus Methanogaster sp. TaxID=3386292 RepID=A0AC61L0Z7_9EURY|nr:MAG: TIGR02710 family CRISPR-associated protein [ANME-2 cluster archaeon]